MKVSIITIVQNQKDFIENCIRSIQSQDYEDIEHIVVDGDSTDGTKEILKKYEDRISKIVSEKDNGIYFAMNKGLSLATGDIIGFLNADDFYADNFIIRKVVKTFKEISVDSVYGDINYVSRYDISKVTRIWKSGDYSIEKFRRGWFPPHPTFFVKKDVYEKCGNFNIAYRFAADVELMVRFLFKFNISVCYIPALLIYMRDNGKSNKSYLNISKSVWECYKAVRHNGIRVSPFYIFNTLYFRLKQAMTLSE